MNNLDKIVKIRKIVLFCVTQVIIVARNQSRHVDALLDSTIEDGEWFGGFPLKNALMLFAVMHETNG
jgi:hypothetical protein